MRKIILIIVGIVLLVLTFFIASKISNSTKKSNTNFEKIVKTVYTKSINNKSIPVIISTSGSLTAKNKIALYSEVQGVLKLTSKEFKPGTNYSKGETILAVNSDEFYADLQSKKSNLFNAITAIMPDIQLDFPNEYDKWHNYLSSFSMEKPTPKLPEPTSDKEKFFISGRGINTSYFTVKNLEVKLAKYSIKAPFSGILTEALVTQGTLVRVGQKLGEFIDPSIFEMEVNVNEAYVYLLKKGNQVKVHNLNKTKDYVASVIRVNAKVDQATQTIKVYLQVKGEGLREGMYLEADLETKAIDNAVEIPRKLLVNNSKLFIVNDTVLSLVPVIPVYFNNETVIIQGLENGTSILSRTLPGAHAGMLVKTIKE